MLGADVTNHSYASTVDAAPTETHLTETDWRATTLEDRSRSVGRVLIRRDQVIAGLVAPAAREVMRRLSGRSMRWADFEELVAEAGAADPVVTCRELSELGLVERTEHSSEGDPWLTTTVAGTALGKARIGTPMTRAKADTILAGVLQRVQEVNADPDALWWVESVELFGSMNDPTKAVVGDVDLRVLLRPRHDSETHFELTKAAAKASGRHFSTLIDELFYASLELQRRIRGRSNRVDIQFDDGALRPLPDGAAATEIYLRAD